MYICSNECITAKIIITMIFNRLQLFVLEKSISFSGCRGTRRDVASILFAGLFLLAVMLPSPVRSQNTTVYNASSLMIGDNDVVREWTNGLSVAYLTNVNGYGNDGAFALIDKTTNTITLASFLSDARVYDFRVVDDSVFFCGSILQGTQDCLLVGSFDINDVFNLGGSISYGVMNTPCSTPYGLSHILRGRKMDTYRNHERGAIHIVAAGDSYMNDRKSDHAILLDACYNGTNWYMSYYEDKTGDEYYSDISCIDNYVVASAMRAHLDNCYIRLFDKAFPFVVQPVYPNQLIEVPCGVPTAQALDETVWNPRVSLTTTSTHENNYYLTLHTGIHTPVIGTESLKAIGK